MLKPVTGASTVMTVALPLGTVTYTAPPKGKCAVAPAGGLPCVKSAVDKLMVQVAAVRLTIMPVWLALGVKVLAAVVV